MVDLEMFSYLSVGDRVDLVINTLSLPDDFEWRVSAYDNDYFDVYYYGRSYRCSFVNALENVDSLREHLLGKMIDARELYNAEESVGDFELCDGNVLDYYLESLPGCYSEEEVSEIFSGDYFEFSNFYNVHKGKFDDEVRGFLSEILDNPFERLWGCGR